MRTVQLLAALIVILFAGIASAATDIEVACDTGGDHEAACICSAPFNHQTWEFLVSGGSCGVKSRAQTPLDAKPCLGVTVGSGPFKGTRHALCGGWSGNVEGNAGAYQRPAADVDLPPDASGINFVYAILLVPVQVVSTHWLAIPIGLRVYLKAHPASALGQDYHSRSALARKIVDLAANLLPDRQIRVSGDGGYATKEFWRDLPDSVKVVSRFPIASKLYDLPVPPPKGRRGRKPKRITRKVSSSIR